MNNSPQKDLDVDVSLFEDLNISDIVENLTPNEDDTSLFNDLVIVEEEINVENPTANEDDASRFSDLVIVEEINVVENPSANEDDSSRFSDLVIVEEEINVVEKPATSSEKDLEDDGSLSNDLMILEEEINVVENPSAKSSSEKDFEDDGSLLKESAIFKIPTSVNKGAKRKCASKTSSNSASDPDVVLLSPKPQSEMKRKGSTKKPQASMPVILKELPRPIKRDVENMSLEELKRRVLQNEKAQEEYRRKIAIENAKSDALDKEIKNTKAAIAKVSANYGKVMQRTSEVESEFETTKKVVKRQLKVQKEIDRLKKQKEAVKRECRIKTNLVRKWQKNLLRKVEVEKEIKKEFSENIEAMSFAVETLDGTGLVSEKVLDETKDRLIDWKMQLALHEDSNVEEIMKLTE